MTDNRLRPNGVRQDPTSNEGTPLSMADFDRGQFRPYLNGLDLTDAQADELEAIVWDMMRIVVEMNLPVESCGQIIDNLFNPTNQETDSVD